MITWLNDVPSIPEAFLRAVREFPAQTIYSQALIHPDDQKAIRPRISRTFEQVAHRVQAIASHLVSQGLKPGDRVAILSNSRHEWVESDLAILLAGGVVVTIYQSLTPKEIGYLLFDSGARIVFAENQEQVDKLFSLLETDIEIPATEERAGIRHQTILSHIISFEEVKSDPRVVLFRDILSTPVVDLSTATQGVSRQDLATIVYTSGTTGPPKGVMQTHGNHLSNVRQAFDAGMYNDQTTIMLFLPLAHSFAKLMQYISCTVGIELKFPAIVNPRSSHADPESITRDIYEANAHLIPLVPRILEKMQAGIIQRSQGKKLANRILALTLWVAQVRSYSVRQSKAVPIGISLLHGLLTPIRGAIRKKLFGAFARNAVSGGAKLNPEVNWFFESLGIIILQGYGLTETCVATNVNRFEGNKIGTVGPVLSHDVEIKIADDGEILFRGPNIARGYLNRPTATSAAWDSEGWFHTGDLGSLDADGYLSITGRKKEIIVTAGGKKIAPEQIEGLLKNSRFISQAVLVGEGQPFCSALVTLNAAAVKEWAAREKKSLHGTFSTDPVVAQLLEQELVIINKDLASYESVKRVAVIDQEFTIENGLMTPTFKVKRGEVVKRYNEVVESLYSR